MSSQNELPTVKCPECGEMSEILEAGMLPPNEVHKEPCDHCWSMISMSYDENGDWTIEAV